MCQSLCDALISNRITKTLKAIQIMSQQYQQSTCRQTKKRGKKRRFLYKSCIECLFIWLSPVSFTFHNGLHHSQNISAKARAPNNIIRRKDKVIIIFGGLGVLKDGKKLWRERERTSREVYREGEYYYTQKDVIRSLLL